MSLYADYHPNTSTKGLGFKDKEKAEYTIRTIQKRPISYQKQVITTMYNRAYHHPHRTKNHERAMRVYAKWMRKHKISYKPL
jgi:hypothetical protein